MHLWLTKNSSPPCAPPWAPHINPVRCEGNSRGGGDEIIVPRGSHVGDVALYEGTGRGMDISEHFVAPPSPDEPDGVHVNIGE